MLFGIFFILMFIFTAWQLNVAIERRKDRNLIVGITLSLLCHLTFAAVFLFDLGTGFIIIGLAFFAAQLAFLVLEIYNDVKERKINSSPRSSAG